jgi:hypothetical protein
MSDTAATIAPNAPRRRRGLAQRKPLSIDGEDWDVRDKMSDAVGISTKTGARIWRHRTKYIGGVAYVPVKQAMHDLVNPPARARRGRHIP